jgi:hypothetical protein
MNVRKGRNNESSSLRMFLEELKSDDIGTNTDHIRYAGGGTGYKQPNPSKHLQERDLNINSNPRV